MALPTYPDPDVLKTYNDWHTQLAVDAEADSPWHQLIRRSLLPERDLPLVESWKSDADAVGSPAGWLVTRGDPEKW